MTDYSTIEIIARLNTVIQGLREALEIADEVKATPETIAELEAAFARVWRLHARLSIGSAIE
jgi:hypothetical protein